MEPFRSCGTHRSVMLGDDETRRNTVPTSAATAAASFSARSSRRSTTTSRRHFRARPTPAASRERRNHLHFPLLSLLSLALLWTILPTSEAFIRPGAPFYLLAPRLPIKTKSDFLHYYYPTSVRNEEFSCSSRRGGSLTQLFIGQSSNNNINSNSNSENYSAAGAGGGGGGVESLQSSSAAIDGDATIAAASSATNQTVNGSYSSSSSTTTTNNSNEEDNSSSSSSSVMSSVTHWSDIMRQESWLDGNNNVSTSSLLLDTVLSDEDCAAIEAYWDRLMPTVSYLGTVAVAKIYKALCVAYRAHRGQMRKSGEPFIVHPVEVALLLSGLKMDAETVMAGLLHDTVEDTELTFAQVEALFGKTVSGIVEGETKVSKLPKQLAFSEYADEQAENLRQMFVAMTDDYRIIIVKLADRLHNMRTLRFMKPEKQIKISRETLDIFAPLAHRMGIWQFKSELEDTAFMYLYPLEYKRLNRRLRQHQKQFRETLDKSQDLLQRRLDSDPTLRQQAAKVEVFGRTKEIYSLWHKMETKNEHNLDNIMDVVALRVVITPKEDPNKEENDTDRGGVWLCYHVLGLVQHLHGFQPVPTKVKDYISFPKPNGYQSLHSALIWNGQTIEVQIRTSLMHQVAEYGMASHWAYKDGKRRKSEGMELYNTPWLSSIKEWQNDRISSRDFVDSVRRELLGKRVFVFLRNGKILNLSRGATAIDAAFQIHTEIGLKMHGVEINGKPVPFSYELRNGDVVSILTGKGKPATDWMRYAKSRSTRSKLRAYFRARQRESLREAGKLWIMDYLWTHRSVIENNSFIEEDYKVPTLNVEDLEDFMKDKTQYEDLDDLLISLGREHDRNKLHKVVSQIFEVPKKLLVEAEEKRRRPGPNAGGVVAAAVQEGRRYAQDVAKNLLANGKSREDLTVSPSLPTVAAPAPVPAPSSDAADAFWSPSKYAMENLVDSLSTRMEYADPEHLCEDCLPVHGDAIVGTRRAGTTMIPTVHRMGCPHALKALNQALAEKRQGSVADTIRKNGSSILNPGPKVDSVVLRQRYGIYGGNIKKTIPSKNGKESYSVPVKLEWSDLDENRTLFLAEIVVVAEDRKLLLADCSEVVSRETTIVKTGSASSEEHATLVFLIKVPGIERIQQLMDSLGKIRSVMSVERRFGSELSEQ